MDPCFLTASEASAFIAQGKLTVEALVRSCLSRIAEREPTVHAWLYVDPDRAIRLARELDKLPRRSPLHGLPFGVKDVIDTADMPTTQNSPLYQEMQVGRDAACVAVVRNSGAIILGKTDTVEFASGGRKAATRHPMNGAHTPGGSSSGSGAAVGDFQVPLAFGTQTGGSHIRPASFNGIYGIKPTHGAVSREGAKMYSHTLDTIGWYGRSVDDLILVAEAFRLPGIDSMSPVELRGLRIGLCESPQWGHAEPAMQEALYAAGRRLEAAGAVVTDAPLPAGFAKLADAQEIIMHGEGRAAFLPEYLGAYEKLGQDFRDKVENVMQITPASLLAQYAVADALRPQFDGIFGDTLDLVLTPGAAGEAPLGLHTTGDHIFNKSWTLLHAPCVGIPAGRGPQGLPLGLQVVGPRFGDARLLAMAKAIAPVLDITPLARG
ncbi:amidase [Acidisphaera sp. L21]|uniref:amidase n=1 Tax=Acidisphaera sp. L21 TaxID=1641851 RepID=UPI00131C696B|nr:amidase [Acidisphaera sp. L21]